MDTRQITINFQLATASRLATEGKNFRSQLLTIQQQLRELTEVRDEELGRLENSSNAALQTELRRIEADVDSQLETLQLDCRIRAESLNESHDQALRQLTGRMSEDVARLEEQRTSETWILQSVLDEDTDDSPVAQFDREAETFVTQKAFLDQRFELLQEQLQRTGQFLSSCHASTDSAL
ncbi:MAG: hypothetical protein ABGZ53_25585, partial [Fuerstiella sp.]